MQSKRISFDEMNDDENERVKKVLIDAAMAEEGSHVFDSFESECMSPSSKRATQQIIPRRKDLQLFQPFDADQVTTVAVFSIFSRNNKIFTDSQRLNETASHEAKSEIEYGL